ncbi:hypothetical protein SHELI_v1c05500 [Spiroplasma helicoides]|uniref:Uncharacterized protein n=1 Tax=Spiroplasma helicoides TaxID=216938 RepID=A0A1B3SKP6_9MOLU|nr:hypothetical protein [Spiroplasma helicoides]AOG60501.1 hypothetical protein SHELI_v1c05500 [Spiroplasma helicoides]
MILVITLLASLFFIFQKKDAAKIINKVNNTVTFKLLYGIKLKHSYYIPKDFEYNKTLKNELDVVKEQKLSSLKAFFTIKPKKDFTKTRTIWLLPLDHIKTIKTKRFDLDKPFFLTRGISENNANKSIKLFKNHKKTFNECYKELKKVYIGNEFNKDFYREAIPKLIY